MKTLKYSINKDQHNIGTLTLFLNDDESVKGRQLFIPAYNLKAQVFERNDKPGMYRISVPENYETAEGEKTFWHDIGTTHENVVSIPAYGLEAVTKAL
jgi:hypothetical protein